LVFMLCKHKCCQEPSSPLTRIATITNNPTVAWPEWQRNYIRQEYMQISKLPSCLHALSCETIQVAKKIAHVFCYHGMIFLTLSSKQKIHFVAMYMNSTRARKLAQSFDFHSESSRFQY
jgi:hypothetical protein